jgi:transcriptional regulator with XRE-family HTH domain
MEFGSLLRALREERMLSQRELSKLSIQPLTGKPLSCTHVQAIESGRIVSFRIETLQALAHGLGVRPDILLAEAMQYGQIEE